MENSTIILHVEFRINFASGGERERADRVERRERTALDADVNGILANEVASQKGIRWEGDAQDGRRVLKLPATPTQTLTLTVQGREDEAGGAAFLVSHDPGNARQGDGTGRVLARSSRGSASSPSSRPRTSSEGLQRHAPPHDPPRSMIVEIDRENGKGAR